LSFEAFVFRDNFFRGGSVAALFLGFHGFLISAIERLCGRPELTTFNATEDSARELPR
jgi:hypothetical protein